MRERTLGFHVSGGEFVCSAAVGEKVRRDGSEQTDGRTDGRRRERYR